MEAWILDYFLLQCLILGKAEWACSVTMWIVRVVVYLAVALETLHLILACGTIANAESAPWNIVRIVEIEKRPYLIRISSIIETNISFAIDWIVGSHKPSLVEKHTGSNKHSKSKDNSYNATTEICDSSLGIWVYGGVRSIGN